VKGFIGGLVVEKVFVEMMRVQNFAFQLAVNQRENGAFMLIINEPCQVIMVAFQFFAVIVHHAAGNDNHGILVFSTGLADGLVRLVVALVGNGTRVYNHNISLLVKIHYLITCILKLRSQGIGFKLIEATTKGFECNFCHNLLKPNRFSKPVRFYSVIA
jgi:hypothetical protein